MSHVLVVFFSLFISCISALCANFEYNPNLFTIEGSTWNKGNEYYNDIYYQEELVFRILKRHIHLFNDYRMEALRRDVNLKCKNMNTGFFDSAAEIHNHFYVCEEKCEGITIDPGALVLFQRGLICIDYYVRISSSNVQESYPIDKQTYKKFQVLKASAFSNDKNILLDLNTLIVHPERAFKEFDARFKAVEKEINGKQTCVICMESPSNVLFQPCNHLCACEKCAENMDACHMCRTHVDVKKKVFLN